LRNDLQPIGRRRKSHGVVRVVVESVDTGDRKLMFGYTARHIVTTEKFDLSQSSCSVGGTQQKYDGWYIDSPYTNKCSTSETEPFDPRVEFGLCNDKFVVERKGSAVGFGLLETETWMENGHEMSAGYSVTAISHEDLDPSLFAKPANI